MASDITRKTFTPRKHYSGVLMQQGRVQLDADWNEQLDIEQYRTHTESTDVIGQSGAPRAVNNGNSFKITVSANGNDIQVDWGRMYVEGLLCELEKPTTYLTQPQYPLPDTSFFNSAPGSPASPPGSPASPPDSPTSPPGSPASPSSPLSPGRLSNGTYIAYLEAWQREVNYLDDPQIQEVALGGPDTTTRLQTTWQVKLLRVSTSTNNTDACDTAFAAWTTLTNQPTGKLNVQTKQATATQDPCLLPPSAGFRRVENQLYRVEVHRGGTLAQTTFKWSRDNASVETIIEKVQGGVLTVADTGKDEVLSFVVGNWVEIVDDLSDLNQHPQRLYQITDVKPEIREITLDVTNLARTPVGKMKLRRWDQSGVGATADGITASNSWIDLEDGVQVQFSGNAFQTGDYWLVPARTITGSIEWPLVSGVYQPQSPVGVHHVFTRLALLKANNGVVTVADCRKVFRPLTNLHASDIYYDNSGCLGSSATTVQEALDILCRRNGSACTFIAQPGPGWEVVFSQIAKGQDAQICFQAGIYPLRAPVDISGKGNLKLIGAGRATRILSTGQEKGLVFSKCTSVLARDLYIETDGTGYTGDRNELNGGLTFIDCNEVQIDTVDAKCGSGRARAATCFTVRNADIARVQNCDLSVGHYQQGILLVNTKEAFVSQNTIKTYSRPGILDFTTILSDNVIRANFRRAIVSELRIAETREPLGGRNVGMTIGDRHVSLKTKPALKDTFKKILTEAPAESVSSAARIRKHVDKTVERLLTDEPFRVKFPAFNAYFIDLAKNTDSVSSQAITVGGTIAAKIKITDNTIENAMQGIHVGVSHHAPRNVHDHGGSILIAGNNIGIKLPANTHKQGRHGVFVGNCKDVLIENNTITLTRLDESDYIFIDGIRVWGILGNRLMVTKNNIHEVNGNMQRSFDVGIRVKPIIPNRGSQWVVMWNIAPSKQSTVIVSGGAINVPNTNFP